MQFYKLIAASRCLRWTREEITVVFRGDVTMSRQQKCFLQNTLFVGICIMQNTNSSRRRAKSEFFFFIFFQNLWKTVNLSSGFLFTSRDGHANRIGILIVLVISKVFVSLPYKHSAMRGQVSQLSTLKRRRSRISVDTAPFFFSQFSGQSQRDFILRK